MPGVQLRADFPVRPIPTALSAVGALILLLRLADVEDTGIDLLGFAVHQEQLNQHNKFY